MPKTRSKDTKESKDATKLRVNLSRADLDALAYIAEQNGLGSTSERVLSHACRFAIRQRARDVAGGHNGVTLDRVVLDSVRADETADNTPWGFCCDDATRADLSKIMDHHELEHLSDAIRFSIRRQAEEERRRVKQ